MRMPSVRYTNPKLSSSAITFGFAFTVLLKSIYRASQIATKTREYMNY